MLVFFTKSNFAVGHSQGQKGMTKSNTSTNWLQYDFSNTGLQLDARQGLKVQLVGYGRMILESTLLSI
ncbi:MAG: hypothetical protein IPN26_17905 [Bacteroidetes bacterium]|nr:hypothetical protein [Bacteroidota bacterium]